LLSLQLVQRATQKLALKQGPALAQVMVLAQVLVLVLVWKRL
jgi:hypothetical protein